MFPAVKPDQTKSWSELRTHYQEAKQWHLRELFKNDPERFRKYSLTLGDIVVDYSKNIITDKTLQLLLNLANESKLQDAIAAMFGGEKINRAENREVLHIALRNCFDDPVYASGKDVMPEVRSVLNQMK